MTEQADIPSLLRSTFFSGQRLTAADLTELQRAHRELRWLHNRSLHAWGIGAGLAVSGERGDSTVTVDPGLGVDCLGREVLLTEPRTVPVPAVAGDPGGGAAVYYLVAAYQADEEQIVAERRPGVCLPEGTVRLSEEPLMEWRQQDQLHEGLELVLAQAWIQNCQVSRALSLAPRRYARPPQQPHIASGQTEVGNTGWTLWQVGDTTLGVATLVDTAAARFRTTPHYMVHVIGDRHVVDGSGNLKLLLTGMGAVVAATPTEFTFQVQLDIRAFGIAIPDLPTLIKEGLEWHVVWMGIEG